MSRRVSGGGVQYYYKSRRDDYFFLAISATTTPPIILLRISCQPVSYYSCTSRWPRRAHATHCSPLSPRRNRIKTARTPEQFDHRSSFEKPLSDYFAFVSNGNFRSGAILAFEHANRSYDENTSGVSPLPFVLRYVLATVVALFMRVITKSFQFLFFFFLLYSLLVFTLHTHICIYKTYTLFDRGKLAIMQYNTYKY